MTNASAKDVIDFWFEQLEPKNWFEKDAVLDQRIASKFSQTLQQASVGELWQWRDTPHGRLAEIIVLDQFSRNIYRDNAKAFATDPLAVALCQEAINIGTDKLLNTTEKSFLYMPLMHSESLKIHDLALEMFNQPGLENNYEFELKHRVIIEEFGRYPHRNEILGRKSTEEELAFWQQPGSSF